MRFVHGAQIETDNMPNHIQRQKALNNNNSKISKLEEPYCFE